MCFFYIEKIPQMILHLSDQQSRYVRESGAARAREHATSAKAPTASTEACSEAVLRLYHKSTRISRILGHESTWRIRWCGHAGINFLMIRSIPIPKKSCTFPALCCTVGSVNFAVTTLFMTTIPPHPLSACKTLHVW